MVRLVYSPKLREAIRYFLNLAFFFFSLCGDVIMKMIHVQLLQCVDWHFTHFVLVAPLVDRQIVTLRFGKLIWLFFFYIHFTAFPILFPRPQWENPARLAEPLCVYCGRRSHKREPWLPETWLHTPLTAGAGGQLWLAAISFLTPPPSAVFPSIAVHVRGADGNNTGLVFQ